MTAIFFFFSVSLKAGKLTSDFVGLPVCPPVCLCLPVGCRGSAANWSSRDFTIPPPVVRVRAHVCISETEASVAPSATTGTTSQTKLSPQQSIKAVWPSTDVSDSSSSHLLVSDDPRSFWRSAADLRNVQPNLPSILKRG